jgi:Flp pilus assembly protein TadD
MYRPRTLINLLLLAFIGLLLLCSTTFGQLSSAAPGLGDTATGYGGRHSISGVVLAPDGRPINSKVVVRLTTDARGDVVGTTDSEGRFGFTRINNGNYTLVVEENPDHGGAIAIVQVEIPRQTPPQNFVVNLRLSPKKGTAGPASKPAVVDAGAAAVPKNATALYDKAVELVKAGDHAGAIALLEKAIAEYHDFLAALDELGVQYLATGDLEKADGTLATALKLKPDDFEALMDRGITLMRLNRLGDAEPLLEQATKVNTTSALAFYYLGRAQFGMKATGAAEASLKAAIGLGGDQVKEAHRTLAKIYLGKNDYSKAADELETYLKLEPSAPDADQLRKTVDQLRAAAQQAPSSTKPL